MELTFEIVKLRAQEIGLDAKEVEFHDGKVIHVLYLRSRKDYSLCSGASFSSPQEAYIFIRGYGCGMKSESKLQPVEEVMNAL
jgi:hypothetical protein